MEASPPEVCEPFPFDLPAQQRAEAIDRVVKSQLAQLTQGVTPYGLASTFAAWWIHLLASPGKQALLTQKAFRKTLRLMFFAISALQEETPARCIEPFDHDHRFRDDGWRRWPYNLISQSFLLTQQWWHNATNDIDGLPREQERIVSFVVRQMLDIASPSNFVITNPKVAKRTIEQTGNNLTNGLQNFAEDWRRVQTCKPPVGAETYIPGRDVAVTKGKVIYRNALVELIQYSPTTDKVKSEPIMVVPAWIMKYYILDLSPSNSLVRYLVDAGYTVFMVSWRNPTSEDRDLSMDDYRRLGVVEPLEIVKSVADNAPVHGVGYCIGGTLLSVAAAAMARDHTGMFKSLTFFATQTDFADPGELSLFISESEVSFLEKLMWAEGVLDNKQMAGAFQLLRSNDLIWSRYVQEYLLGERPEMYDLMAWNADSTRMPYKMHSEYLRRFFLENALAQGKYIVDGQPIAIRDIDAPIFCVSTLTDHVAPWRSVYKIHLLADTDITFVLTSGGHNAGIISEPGHAGRNYQIRTSHENDKYLSPEAWREGAESRHGSWWPAWVAWLNAQSSADASPPAMGGPQNHGEADVFPDSPGDYVHG